MDSEAAVLKHIKDIFLVSSILFLWFKTDFLYSYLKLLGIQNKNYEDTRIEVDIKFIEYLSSSSKNKISEFFFELFSCPFCLNFWLCVIFSIGKYSNFGVTYICSLVVFGITCKIFNND